MRPTFVRPTFIRPLSLAIALLPTASFAAKAHGQDKPDDEAVTQDTRAFFVRLPWHNLNIPVGDIPDINMYEVHAGYRLDAKTSIGIKAATWKLFEPMGIQLWNPDLLKESEWFTGRLKEYGVGVFYQRTLWKGLYGSIEVMPMLKSFVDEAGRTIEHGFRLYSSYHVGYHLSFYGDRFFIEPQIHCNYWPINSDGPEGFKEQIAKHDNYFLFEPNIYFGVNF